MWNHTKEVMNCEIEDWIEDALAAQQLENRKMDSVNAQHVISRIQSRFVNGLPRVWWLGFWAINSRHPSETSKLSVLVTDPDAVGWFIPETEGGRSLVYRLTAKEVEVVIADCPFFEYYFLDITEQLLVAETDHNQFVVATPK